VKKGPASRWPSIILQALCQQFLQRTRLRLDRGVVHAGKLGFLDADPGVCPPLPHQDPAGEGPPRLGVNRRPGKHSAGRRGRQDLNYLSLKRVETV
jgi:hypothetical protein